MVRESYFTAIESDDYHTIARVRNLIAPDADDDTIASYAARNDWVVLTADDDFPSEEIPHGLLLYDDMNSPSPGAVRDAIRQIEQTYSDHSVIVEWVPGDWN